MTWTIHHYDVSVTPWPLEDESVQCVVTSPPYWGLRDYGTARWEGSDAACDHVAEKKPPTLGSSSTLGFPSDGGPRRIGESNTYHEAYTAQYRDTCRKCGARRIDSQIGLEATPDEYVAKLVAVFREVRRVLRKDGTVWLNLGDCYNAARNGGHAGGLNGVSRPEIAQQRSGENVSGLKPKDLVGIPWRVAFALQSDGWWLRSDIVWAKPNPMPESIRDRPTRAHEYVFLLTKAARYFYDQDAIREPGVAEVTKMPDGWATHEGGHGSFHRNGREKGRTGYRHDEARRTSQVSANRVWSDPEAMARIAAQGANARTVWQIATEPFAEAHFATFPTELARRCVLAGTSEAGACWECGAPWVRETERTPGHSFDCPKTEMAAASRGGRGSTSTVGQSGGSRVENKVITLGFRPSCSCNAEARKPCVVLDPFSGAGTVALVADTLGRDAVGLELNPEYVAMSRRRISAPRTEEGKIQAEMEAQGQVVLW